MTEAKRDNWSELTEKYIHMTMYAEISPKDRLDPRDVPSRYRYIVDKIMGAMTSGSAIDLYSIIYEADKTDQSSAKVLREIVERSTIHSERPAALSKRVREHAKSDRAAMLVASMVSAVELSDTDALLTLAGKVSEIVSGSEDEADVVRASEAMAMGLETARNEAKESGGIRTGWPTLDRCYRVTPGSMLTLGAATNVGKSTVITSWLWHMATTGVSAGIISVEDPTEDFGIKALAAASGVDPSALWSMRLSQEDVGKIQSAIARSSIPLYYTWVRTRRLQTVLDRMDHMVRIKGCQVVAVDYLQNVSGPLNVSSKDSLRESTDKVLEALVGKAGELRVGLIVASQLNRAGTESAGTPKAPTMASLKESGTIENRSQCVVLLHRERQRTRRLW